MSWKKKGEMRLECRYLEAEEKEMNLHGLHVRYSNNVKIINTF